MEIQNSRFKIFKLLDFSTSFLIIHYFPKNRDKLSYLPILSLSHFSTFFRCLYTFPLGDDHGNTFIVEFFF